MALRRLTTERLLLRGWQPTDRVPFAALNADLAVNEFLPKPLTRAESDGLADRFEAHRVEHGFTFWAVEAPGVAPFLGAVGLVRVTFEAHFAPAVEIGWRLGREHWGQGYATEAARASLAFAFDVLGLDEVVSFTVPENVRSRAVMERLGMVQDMDGDFDHPKLPAGHRLRRHVLYRAASPR